MEKPVRFDLAYTTMPWDAVDAVVFDIGNVLIRYAPDSFVEMLFPGDAQKQRDMLSQVYGGRYWPAFDRGTMRYDEAAQRLHEEYGYPAEDYRHALYGWLELKTPMEEGWRAVKACRERGKKLCLLSNYPDEGYAYLTRKFADRFSVFDGGVISCRCHCCKPEDAIYRALIRDCALTPARTVFIDDTLMNVEGAMKNGIHGFHMHESGMMDRFFI